jgi:small subunit ribosomal protein S7
MSRRARVYKKPRRFDGKYNSPLVAKLVGRVMKGGKKSTAERLVYRAIDLTLENTDVVDPLEVLMKAVDNAKPRLEVKSRRVGGSTYQVPIEVTPARQESLAIRWMVTFAEKRRSIPMAEALAQEIREAAAGHGNSIRKRDDVHKMAQANRAFAHFRW